MFLATKIPQKREKIPTGHNMVYSGIFKGIHLQLPLSSTLSRSPGKSGKEEIMRPEIYTLLKSKFKHKPIEQKNEISILIDKKHLVSNNKKFMQMYDWMSRGYDFAENLIGKLRYRNSIQQLRSDLISKLEWKNHCKVLYVSIGTGTNLNFLPKSINTDSLEIVGLDISLGMLQKCQKKFSKKINLSLIHCAAEELPFENNAFDIVFHVGGINFFSNKKDAISEMIRVSKPNSKIMIADETSDYINTQYKKSRLSKKYFENEQFYLSEIKNNVPEFVTEKKIEYLWEKKFYCLTFRKPALQSIFQ